MNEEFEEKSVNRKFINKQKKRRKDFDRIEQKLSRHQKHLHKSRKYEILDEDDEY